MFNKIKVSSLIKLYVFINLYKALLGLLWGKSAFTALSICLIIFLFIKYLIQYIAKRDKDFFRTYLLALISICVLHFLYSALVLQSTQTTPLLLSFFQFVAPLFFTFIVFSLQPNTAHNIASFTLKALIPIIFFSFVELMMPLNNRMEIYIAFSKYSGGEEEIGMAYYIGDTNYKLLRLGSLFFDPLTFGFVSSFMVIYMAVKKIKWRFIVFVSNIFSFGKLPIFITVISLFSRVFKKYIIILYLFIAVITCYYFISNASEIILSSPSMANHLQGLIGGVNSALESPLLGHGFGTAGYLSYSYFLQENTPGPFFRKSALLNGNESTVGTLAYQLGFVILFVYIYFIVQLIKNLVKANTMMATAVFGYLIALFLSESVLSITVVSVLVLFCYSTINEKREESYDHRSGRVQSWNGLL